MADKKTRKFTIQEVKKPIWKRRIVTIFIAFIGLQAVALILLKFFAEKPTTLTQVLNSTTEHPSSKQNVLLLAINVSIESYLRKYGKAPASLDDLVPEFLDEVPIDPISGQKFKLEGPNDKLEPTLEIDGGGEAVAQASTAPVRGTFIVKLPIRTIKSEEQSSKFTFITEWDVFENKVLGIRVEARPIVEPIKAPGIVLFKISVSDWSIKQTADGGFTATSLTRFFVQEKGEKLRYTTQAKIEGRYSATSGILATLKIGKEEGGTRIKVPSNTDWLVKRDNGHFDLDITQELTSTK